MRNWIGMVLLAMSVAHAHAQTWPARPVRLVVANAAGAATDIAGRVFADHLSQRVGQAVAVENRPGADGFIAAETVARSAPDGHTLFFATQSIFAIDPHIKKSMPVDPVRDFTPIAVIIDDTGATAIAAHPSMPFRTLPEMFAHAKANPGKVTYATVVPLFTMLGEWLGKRAGIHIVEVPYKNNAQANQDAIAGRVSLLLQSMGSLEPLIRSGKLHLLALTRPVADWRQVPLVADYFPGFSMRSWATLVGPAGMPRELAQRINQESAQVVREEKFAQALAKIRWGNAEGARTPEGTAEFIRMERERWGQFIGEIGLKPH